MNVASVSVALMVFSGINEYMLRNLLHATNVASALVTRRLLTNIQEHMPERSLLLAMSVERVSVIGRISRSIKKDIQVKSHVCITRVARILPGQAIFISQN